MSSHIDYITVYIFIFMFIFMCVCVYIVLMLIFALYSLIYWHLIYAY